MDINSCPLICQNLCGKSDRAGGQGSLRVVHAGQPLGTQNRAENGSGKFPTTLTKLVTSQLKDLGNAGDFRPLDKKDTVFLILLCVSSRSFLGIPSLLVISSRLWLSIEHWLDADNADHFSVDHSLSSPTAIQLPVRLAVHLGVS